MYQRLKKLKSHQIKKVYCRMMKVKNTSLKKDKMISKLLAPLQKKYRMEKMSPKSRKYLEELTEKEQNIQLKENVPILDKYVKDNILSYLRQPGSMHPSGSVVGRKSRGIVSLNKKIDLRDQIVKVTLPSIERTSFLGDSLVRESIPKGKKITIEEITELMDDIDPSKLTDVQRKEVRRLFAIAYEKEYAKEWLFGKGKYAKTYSNRDLEERKDHRAKLLEKLDDKTSSLPIPLGILRKAKLYGIPESDRYPRNTDGTVDETDDMFWPRTKPNVFDFLYLIPTIEEIQTYGW
jgi:hypothetical protein